MAGDANLVAGARKANIRAVCIAICSECRSHGQSRGRLYQGAVPILSNSLLFSIALRAVRGRTHSPRVKVYGLKFARIALT